MIQYIKVGTDLSGNVIYGRIDADGLMRVTCTAENSDYQAYLNPDKVEHLTEIPTGGN